jgi:two-component system sensor histidine kinase UhpB
MEDRVPKSGFGLLGIRERVASLKGQFALINSPGAGLELRVVLPELADEVE